MLRTSNKANVKPAAKASHSWRGCSKVLSRFMMMIHVDYPKDRRPELMTVGAFIDAVRGALAR